MKKLTLTEVETVLADKRITSDQYNELSHIATLMRHGMPAYKTRCSAYSAALRTIAWCDSKGFLDEF